MLFNEGSMPKFDYTDEALVDRMIVVKHRSRFCPTIEDYNKNSHLDHTYLADNNIENKIIIWRPYLLKWCLDGLNKYYIHKFKKIPESCILLKKSIVSGQDIVKDFIDRNLIQTNDVKDYVEQVKLYDNFYKSYKEESDKKTALGKNKFYQRLKQILGDENFREDTKCNGIRCKKIFLNWKKINDIALT